MPQAPSYLQEMFSGDDDAFDALSAENFSVSRGGIICVRRGYTPTERENHAIDYLCMEWDYGFKAEEP